MFLGFNTNDIRPLAPTTTTHYPFRSPDLFHHHLFSTSTTQFQHTTVAPLARCYHHPASTSDTKKTTRHHLFPTTTPVFDSDIDHHNPRQQHVEQRSHIYASSHQSHHQYGSSQSQQRTQEAAVATQMAAGQPGLETQHILHQENVRVVFGHL